MSVDYHRHCQATVLSAYGVGGNGATWNILSAAGLTNLPTDWITHFNGSRSSDGGNITQDLRGILELIDYNAQRINNLKFTVGISNHDGSNENTHMFQPGQIDNDTYIFKVGKSITFQNGDDEQVVPTLGSDDDTVDFSNFMHTLTFNQHNGDTSVKVVMPADNTIDISYDYCLIPATSSSSTTITPEESSHIYRISKYSSFTLNFNFSNYNGYKTDIVAFEVWVTNTNTSSAITVTMPSGVQLLTDELEVAAGQTNVFVFRHDMTTSKTTESLAYIIT